MPRPSFANQSPTPTAACLGNCERAGFYRFERVMIVVWRDVPRVPDVEEMSAVAMALKEDGPLAVVQQLAPRSRMPDGETRSKIIKTWLRVGHDLIAMDLVLQAQGFWASAARSAINGMIMASRQRAPIRVSTALGEHTPWLLSLMSARLGHAPAQAELCRAVAEATQTARAL